MAFTFHIRPIGLDKGFDLSCDGIFPDSVHHSRLIEAVIHAVQVGHLLEGEIQVFDCEGNVAEILPVRWEDRENGRGNVRATMRRSESLPQNALQDQALHSAA